MPYTYETHLHTCQGSACGRSTGAEQARFYKEIGYAGIIKALAAPRILEAAELDTGHIVDVPGTRHLPEQLVILAMGIRIAE